MVTDQDMLEKVVAPTRRSPARTAAMLAGAGVITMVVGALLLVLAVSRFDTSLTSATQRGVDRTKLGGAEVSVGTTELVMLDDDRVKTLVAVVDGDVPSDVDVENLVLPTVSIGAPDGSIDVVFPTDPLELAVDGDRRTVAIGQFRTGDAGAYEVEVAADGGDAVAVGMTNDLLPDPGDLGGAAGTFLVSAAAATLLGLGALLVVVGALGWLWFRRHEDAMRRAGHR